jgi:peptidoglycan/LPS O-acetylase OafA/YrhL
MSAVGIESGVLYAAAVVGLVVGALLIAYAMWRWIEEPAREWMRGLAGTRPVPTEEAGERIAEELPPDAPAAPIDIPER